MAYGVLVEHQSRRSAGDNHSYRVQFVSSGADKGDEEDEATDDEGVTVFDGRGEVLFVHQHQCRRGEQTYHGRAQSAEHGFHGRVLLVFQEELADGQHQDERGQHHGKGGYDGAPYAARGGEADVGGGIDADDVRRYERIPCHRKRSRYQG